MNQDDDQIAQIKGLDLRGDQQSEVEKMRKTTQVRSSPNDGPKLSFLQEINREAESIIQRSILGGEDDSDTYEPKVHPQNVGVEKMATNSDVRQSYKLAASEQKPPLDLNKSPSKSPRSQREPKMMTHTRTTLKPKNSLSQLRDISPYRVSQLSERQQS